MSYAGSAIVIRGNASCLPLPDASIDMICTSPPYFALRSYRDGDEHYDGQVGSEATPQAFLEALWACTAEWWRVLKPTGSLWVNLGDKYAGSGGHNNSGISDKSTLRGNGHVGGVGEAGPTKIKSTLRSAPDRYNQESDGIRPKSLMGLPWRYAIGCIDRGWILRRDLVWSKPNGLPESVTDRCRSSHEYWFHLTKQGRYFAAMDELREELAPKTLTHRGGGESWGNESNPDNNWGDAKVRTPDARGKLPGSVWTIPMEPLTISDDVRAHYNLPDHFAAFPQEWPRRLILGWSPSGICVECGEGRRPVASKELVGGSPKGERDYRRLANGSNGGVERPLPGGSNEVTITGYACACPTPDAPSRPAVILDPFGGTGTTAGVARTLGRIGISVDLSMDYCRLAKWRIFRSGHFAKTETRTHADRAQVLF